MSLVGSLPAIAQEASFTDWLATYGAYDTLERELAERPPAPHFILKRAELLLRLNQPEKALDLLNEYDNFVSSSDESERLWLKAQSLRLNGDAVTALLTYTRAGMSMPAAERVDRFRQEPQLDRFFEDTWRYWFWSKFTGRKLRVDPDQYGQMLESAELVKEIWPDNSIWSSILSNQDYFDPARETPQFVPATSNVLPVFKSEQESIVRALAACALKQWSLAEKELAALGEEQLRLFWTDVVFALGKGSPSEAPHVPLFPYPKASVFWEVHGHQFDRESLSGWTIEEPQDDFWADFRQFLSDKSPGQALDIIRDELRSTLLAPKVKSALHDLHLAYAILDGDFVRSNRDLSPKDVVQLPLTLRLALLVLGEDFESLETEDTVALDTRKRMLLNEMASAAGRHSAPVLVAPFWIKMDREEQMWEAWREWPLDRTLTYGVNRREWTQNPTLRRARRLAFLYPLTPAGQEALLHLAQSYNRSGRRDLAWQSVVSVPMEELSSSLRSDFLEARAGLAMELGREDLALETYEMLLREAPERVTPIKKLKLALLAQRLDRWDMAQQMLDELWESRQGLEPAVQAEVLFWLAEGEQHRDNLDTALDHYLELAWRYPEQNIWAVTSLYRAGLIYEQRGLYGPARQLFTAVLKRADRESQRQAAQDRIEALSSLAGVQEDGNAPWTYPF